VREVLTCSSLGLARELRAQEWSNVEAAHTAPTGRLSTRTGWLCSKVLCGLLRWKHRLGQGLGLCHIVRKPRSPCVQQSSVVPVMRDHACKAEAWLERCGVAAHC